MPADKEVTRVDQDKINLFSRMNQRMTDIDASIASRKKTVTDIEDANEIVENLQIVEEDAPGKKRLHKCNVTDLIKLKRFQSLALNHEFLKRKSFHYIFSILPYWRMFHAPNM